MTRGKSNRTPKRYQHPLVGRRVCYVDGCGKFRVARVVSDEKLRDGMTGNCDVAEFKNKRHLMLLDGAWVLDVKGLVPGRFTLNGKPIDIEEWIATGFHHRHEDRTSFARNRQGMTWPEIKEIIGLGCKGRAQGPIPLSATGWRGLAEQPPTSSRRPKARWDDARLWHPWLRINRVLGVMLYTHWSAEAWAQVRVEFWKRSCYGAESGDAGWFS
jgi:hypothetical protein